MLLNQFVFTQAPIKSAEPALILREADAQLERLALAPAATEAPVSDTPKPKTAPEPTPASGKRAPRPLLLAYAGLTRVEAIAQLLRTTQGQDVTADQISEGLFGNLSGADHKAERKSLNTQLYKGQSQKLWKKGTAPGTYTIGAPTSSVNAQSKTKAPAPKAGPQAMIAKRKSLTLLPPYAELTKREAIVQVLTTAFGEVMHQDTIIKSLHGDLSLEKLKEERVWIKTALLTGVKDQKWQKATPLSSYFIKATGVSAKSKKSVGNSKPQPTKAEAEGAIAPIDPPTPEINSAAESTAAAIGKCR